MTDQPEPICGPSCDPMICHAGHCALEPEHAHKLNDQASEHALRDKVRDTIHAASLGCVDYHAADCRACTSSASLVMSLAVQPVLDRKAAEIAEARAYARYLDEDVIKPERELHEQTIKRAEAADAEVARLRAELSEKAAEVDDKSDVGHAVTQAWQQRAEAAEAEAARLREQQAGITIPGMTTQQIRELIQQHPMDNERSS